MDKPSVQRSLSLFTGTYDPTTNPSTFKKLQLTFTCNGKWKVTNLNRVPISFTWSTDGTNEQGLGVVPANNSTFFYSLTNGNKARVFVNTLLQDVEPSNQDPCNTPKGNFVWSEDSKTLTFTPTEPLLADTDYVLVLSSLAKTTTGTLLGQPYTLSFSTKLPPLPEPWQRLQLTGTTGCSTYNDTSQTFTLNTSSTNSEESSHFIYQSINIDASIEAKVQLAANSPTTAKAGIMLRQSNEATSAYVFAYMQDGRVKVDYP